MLRCTVLPHYPHLNISEILGMCLSVAESEEQSGGSSWAGVVTVCICAAPLGKIQKTSASKCAEKSAGSLEENLRDTMEHS